MNGGEGSGSGIEEEEEAGSTTKQSYEAEMKEEGTDIEEME